MSAAGIGALQIMETTDQHFLTSRKFHGTTHSSLPKRAYLEEVVEGAFFSLNQTGRSGRES